MHTFRCGVLFVSDNFILSLRLPSVAHSLLARHPFCWEPPEISQSSPRPVYPASPILPSVRIFRFILLTQIFCHSDRLIASTGGNVGVSPATITSVTGFSLVQDVSTQFWTSTQVDGRVMGSTDGLPTPGLLTVAVLDMQAAFTDAMSKPLLC
jgi:hypothetical protein